MRWLNLSTATRIANFGRSRPVWQRTCGAIALTALVVLGRMALNGALGRQHNRHLFFIPTVMLVAWLFGLGPGLLSVVMSTVALALFWTEHPGGIDLAQAELVLFFLISVAVCALIESLQVARARADQASKAHEQVLAIVAHDLRNPLSTIKMTLDRMRRAPSDEGSGSRRITTIDRAVLRMEHLIRDLVDATRIEQGSLALALHPERVDSIVHEAVELVAPLAQERSISLEVPTDGDGAVVACDRGRLLQVMGNLLGNALKFTPEGGRITVGASSGIDMVRFHVDDTGPGVPPQDVPHLFKRYWKSDPKGTGLGLFIAESIVRAHGGSMGVRSEVGLGASFYFDVPLAR